MAIISQGLFMNVDVIDSGGNKSKMSFKLNPACAAFASLETLGAVAGQTRVLDILGELGLVTDARIAGYKLGEEFKETDTALKYGPAGSEVERKASITVPLDGRPFDTVTLSIPSPAAGIFINDGAPGPKKNTVDPVDADIVSWMARYQATVSDADPFTGDFLISDGESIADGAAIEGKQIHRGSRKG